MFYLQNRNNKFHYKYKYNEVQCQVIQSNIGTNVIKNRTNHKCLSMYV